MIDYVWADNLSELVRKINEKNIQGREILIIYPPEADNSLYWRCIYEKTKGE